MKWLVCAMTFVAAVFEGRSELASEDEWALRNRLLLEVRDMEMHRNALVNQIRVREETAETLSTAALLMSGELNAPPEPIAESVVPIFAYETERPVVLVGNGGHNCRHRWVDVREGGLYRCKASVRAADVRGTRSVKFGAMLVCPDGAKKWPSAKLGVGSYDWTDVAFEFIVPAGCRKSMILYGLEGGEGTVEFKDVRIMEVVNGSK